MADDGWKESDSDQYFPGKGVELDSVFLFLQAILDGPAGVDWEANCVPVTLIMAGAVISGDLVTEQQYFRELSALLEKGVAKSGVHVANVMKYTVEQFRVDAKEAMNTKSEPPSEFCHVRNASVMSARAPGEQGLLLRIRLDAIQGFAFGRLS